VLACAPSNLAVDNLVEKLGAAKAKVHLALSVCDDLVTLNLHVYHMELGLERILMLHVHVDCPNWSPS
jgi:hypothetical protein